MRSADAFRYIHIYIIFYFGVANICLSVMFKVTVKRTLSPGKRRRESLTGALMTSALIRGKTQVDFASLVCGQFVFLMRVFSRLP